MSTLNKTRHFRLTDQLESKLLELSKRLRARPSGVIRKLISESFATTQPAEWTRLPRDAQPSGPLR
jgi:hypothetical protein